jgi:signal transduction histidine kinase
MMDKAVILLVEDDAALREGMSDTLESEGYKTVQAGNGLEGLEALERIFPDLIISDIMMPEMDGYTFHDEVASNPKTATVPFIFLTAKSDQADVLKGLRVGVDAYLTKPFDLEQLLAHVQNKLHRFAVVRKQAMLQLEELQHQIVNMFSHELRTPLTYITGYTDLLAGSPSSISPEELKLFLKGLRAGTDRLNRMVENILTLVHLGTQVYDQEFAEYAVVRTDISRMVNDVVKEYRDAAAGKGLGIQVEIADALPPVRHLETLLPRALNCLIDNAVKFSRTAGSQINVRAYQANGRVIIDVIDEGIGIAPEDLERIFEPFVQIDRAKYEQAGVGIGLTIARGLARVHQGDVIVESQHGVGSKFSLWLPAAEAAE